MPPDTIASLVCNSIADEQFNVSKLAELLGVSTRWLHLLFLEHYAMAPRQLLEAMRLQRAVLFLASGMALSEVCPEVGYYCTKTLTQACKRRLGKTPACLRREILASGNRELFLRSLNTKLFTEKALFFVQK